MAKNTAKKATGARQAKTWEDQLQGCVDRIESAVTSGGATLSLGGQRYLADKKTKSRFEKYEEKWKARTSDGIAGDRVYRTAEAVGKIAVLLAKLRGKPSFPVGRNELKDAIAAARNYCTASRAKRGPWCPGPEN